MNYDESYNKQIGYPGCLLTFLVIVALILYACNPKNETLKDSQNVQNGINSGELQDQGNKPKQGLERPPAE